MDARQLYRESLGHDLDRSKDGAKLFLIHNSTPTTPIRMPALI